MTRCNILPPVDLIGSKEKNNIDYVLRMFLEDANVFRSLAPIGSIDSPISRPQWYCDGESGAMLRCVDVDVDSSKLVTSWKQLALVACSKLKDDA